jgi:serine/threonine protein kinase
MILQNEKGSKAYMSPQMFRTSRHKMIYNANKADVWSAGVTYFVMLFGKLPFTDTGPFDCNYYFNHFCKNGNDGKQIFWNQHNLESSGIIVSNETKQFFDYIFIEDENKRPTIDEILKHPYVINENTRCTDFEKIEIMNSLKNRIDEEIENTIVIDENNKVTNNGYNSCLKESADS